MLLSTTGAQKACQLLPAHPTPVGMTEWGKGHLMSQQAPSGGQMTAPVHGKPISKCERRTWKAAPV